MATYKLCNSPSTGKLCAILKDEGNGRFLSIPVAEGNTDYQEYLKWVAEGNTAEAAD
jgi:hypothetical protein